MRIVVGYRPVKLGQLSRQGPTELSPEVARGSMQAVSQSSGVWKKVGVGYQSVSKRQLDCQRRTELTPEGVVRVSMLAVAGYRSSEVLQMVVGG